MQTQQQVSPQVIAEIAKEVVARLRVQIQPAPAAQAHAPGTQGRRPARWRVRHRGRGRECGLRGAKEGRGDEPCRSRPHRSKSSAASATTAARNSAAWSSRRPKSAASITRFSSSPTCASCLASDALRSEARSNHTGLCIIEHAPWGVIGMMLPVTHSVPTMASNAINIVAAGNTAVFGPHPSGAKVAQYALQLWNREIERELGVANVFTTTPSPSIEAAEQIFHHPKVALLCCTGGTAVAQAAAKTGKRVIAGGPGNPPVVVDETADLDRAARCIIEGAAFDNNLLCIGEKEVFVVASVADAFIAAMRRAGAYQLDAAAIDRLTKAAFTFEGGGGGCARAHVKKDLVGKDVAVLAAAAGVHVPPEYRSALRRDE